jgi:hypothetical protein
MYAQFTGEIVILEENLSQCHFVYHKSLMDWPGIKLGPPWRVVGVNLLSDS